VSPGMLVWQGCSCSGSSPHLAMVGQLGSIPRLEAVPRGEDGWITGHKNQ